MRFLKKLEDIRQSKDSDIIIEMENNKLEMVISKLIKKVTRLEEDGFYVDDYCINFDVINERGFRTAEYIELDHILEWIENQ